MRETLSVIVHAKYQAVKALAILALTALYRPVCRSWQSLLSRHFGSANTLYMGMQALNCPPETKSGFGSMRQEILSMD